MTTATKEVSKPTEGQARGEILPAIAGPRLPYHPLIEQRFGIDRASWKALVEAVFPNATSVESVILALSYCRARKLDPFKRNVHIVPIWNKQTGGMIDTIWPGIGELRTTAFRTGEYAGRDQTVFGPTITKKIGNVEMTFPEWSQVTVYRMVKGQKVAFAGPQVFWLETYATAKRNDDTPNEMWQTRPWGQIDKCGEAAALRAAFPEECGGDYIPEEVQHGKAVTTVEGTAKETLDDLAARLEGPSPPLPPPVTEDAAEESQVSDAPAIDGEFIDMVRNDLAGCNTVAEVDDMSARHYAAAKTDAERTAVQGLAKECRDSMKPAKGKQQKELVS